MTATQALELFDDETVPETEVYDESVDRAIIAVDNVTERVGATRPPTPAQIPILSPIPFRDTLPDLGAPYNSQIGCTTEIWNPIQVGEPG